MSKKTLKQSKSIEIEIFNFLLRKGYKIYPISKSRSWLIEIDLFGYIQTEKKYIFETEIQNELVEVYNREFSLYSKTLNLDLQLIENNIFVVYEKLKNDSYRVVVKNPVSKETKKFSKVLESFDELRKAIEKTVEFYHKKLS